MTRDEMAMLRPLNASMGLMLEIDLAAAARERRQCINGRPTRIRAADAR